MLGSNGPSEEEDPAEEDSEGISAELRLTELQASTTTEEVVEENAEVVAIIAEAEAVEACKKATPKNTLMISLTGTPDTPTKDTTSSQERRE